MTSPGIQDLASPWIRLRSVCMGDCAYGGALVILKGEGTDIFVCIYFLLLFLTGEVCTCLRLRLGEQTSFFKNH